MPPKKKLKGLTTVEATLACAFREAADAISRYVEHLEKLDSKRQDLEARASALTAKDGRKKKRKRDPNAPKAPLSSYMIFANEHREKLRAKHPNLSMQDIMVLAGELWRDTPEREKKKYERVAEKQREEHQRAKQEYAARQRDDTLVEEEDDDAATLD